MLPGLDKDYTHRSVALTWNDCGNFRDQWVSLAVNDKSPCVFTRHLDKVFDLPVRHGEGKFVADPAVVQRLLDNNQVVLTYARSDGTPAHGEFPANPNGSMADIAGICDPMGRVFGLMPHPEAYNHFTNHPDWTGDRGRCTAPTSTGADAAGPTPGVQLLRNGVSTVLQMMQ